jgi:hypothetical protein
MKSDTSPRTLASEAVEPQPKVGAVWAFRGHANGKTPDHQGFFWR